MRSRGYRWTQRDEVAHMLVPSRAGAINWTDYSSTVLHTVQCTSAESFEPGETKKYGNAE